MTVLCPHPNRLDNNFICYLGDMSGLTAICEMLKTNSSLRELRCASTISPISKALSPVLHSEK